MPGSIQSVERAAAVLHLLGTASGPMALADLALALDLAKPTVHGLVRTLVGVGFVDQDSATGRYLLGEGLTVLSRGGLDPHELRSRSMNWADRLAARTGLEVQLAVPGDGAAEIVHHVFRPDDTPQRLRTGEHHPLHATALGLVLLAHVAAAPDLRALTLTAYTSATPTDLDRLTATVGAVRVLGHATEDGEHRPDTAAIAAPIRHRGGLGVAALAVLGPRERVLDAAGEPRRGLLQQTLDAAHAVSVALDERP